MVPTEGENNAQLSINYHDYSAFCLNYHSIIVQPLLYVLYATKSTFVLKNICSTLIVSLCIFIYFYNMHKLSVINYTEKYDKPLHM